MSDTDGWVGAAEAEAITGFSRRKIDRLVADAVIASEKRSGKTLYCPTDLARIAKRGDETSAGKMLELTQKHLERLLLNYDKPLTLLLDALKSEMQGQRERIKELEATHLQSLRALDEAQTDNLMRELAAKDHAAGLQRKGEVVSMFREKLLPRIVSGLGKNDVSEFLGSMSPDQWEVLAGSDFFTSQQMAALEKLMPAKTKTNGKAETKSQN